jgi:hypothetical protein
MYKYILQRHISGVNSLHITELNARRIRTAFLLGVYFIHH